MAYGCWSKGGRSLRYFYVAETLKSRPGRTLEAALSWTMDMNPVAAHLSAVAARSTKRWKTGGGRGPSSPLATNTFTAGGLSSEPQNNAWQQELPTEVRGANAGHLSPGEAGVELSNWNWKVVRQFLKQSFDLGLASRSIMLELPTPAGQVCAEAAQESSCPLES